MPALDRAALEASPLADLHELASELDIDGYRRLGRDQLVARILAAAGGGDEHDVPPAEPLTLVAPDAAPAAAEPFAMPAPVVEDYTAPIDDAPQDVTGEPRDADGEQPASEESDAPEPVGRSRSRRAPRERERERDRDRDDRQVEGVVELLPNGSGFVRIAPPEETDDDVYISAAQVRRCELVDGDRVSGPVRSPRRSERHPSLVRVETINGAPADEVSEGTPFDSRPAAFPSVRLELGSDDVTLRAIEWLLPIGLGSRVVIAGPARAGKSELLRRLAAALSGRETLDVAVALAGVRPEELGEWHAGAVAVAAATSLASPQDARAAALDQATETARRVAARGGHAVLLVDGLDSAGEACARRTLAAARTIVDGGTLTVIATAAAALGGETTVITLDPARTAAGAFPALDLSASGTVRPELLVGDEGAAAIRRAYAEG